MSAVAYLRLYRVKDWVHFLPLPLAGWVADAHRPTVTSLVAGIGAWGLGLAYASAINQAFDGALDPEAKNPVGGTFSRRRAILLAIPPAVASLVLLTAFSPAGVLPDVALLAAATLYSAPPRLKRFPVVGTAWNLVVAVPGFFFAARPAVDTLPLRLLVGLFAVLLLGSQLIHEAQDHDDDVAGGVRTVATEGGRRVALVAAALLALATPGVAWSLAGGADRRVEITVACVVFAVAWGAVLWTRTRSASEAELKRLRVRYRYSAICLGAVVFAATQV